MTVNQLLPLIEQKKAIIYLDFAKDIDPLAIALREAREAVWRVAVIKDRRCLAMTRPKS